MENEEEIILKPESKEAPTLIWIICIWNFLILGKGLILVIKYSVPFIDQKWNSIYYILISLTGIIACIGLITMKKWALYTYTAFYIMLLCVSKPLNLILCTIALIIVWSYLKKFNGQSNVIEEKRADENDITNLDDPCDSNAAYSAPEIKSQKRSVEKSFWNGDREIIHIEFADGVKGSINYIPFKNEYYFKEISQYSPTFHYYDNFTNCVNAFYNFETKGEVLKVGYLNGHN